MVEEKRLIVIGGPNGAGKTTFAMGYQQETTIRYLAADDIAARMRPGAPEEARIEAGKAFSRELRSAIAAGKSLLVESTLSGRSFLRPLAQAREVGYRTEILFVTQESAEACIQRVRERVLRGGHHVPDEDVRRRFDRSHRNFWGIYRLEVDAWSLYSNTEEGFTLMALGERSEYEVVDEAGLRRFLLGIGEIL